LRNMQLDITPCKYSLMGYESRRVYSGIDSVKESIAVMRQYMDEFFGSSTTCRQIDIYVNTNVRIKFRDEEMYTMFKLGHG
jgi:hypothetical protein